MIFKDGGRSPIRTREWFSTHSCASALMHMYLIHIDYMLDISCTFQTLSLLFLIK